MALERIFLGWDEPFLGTAVNFLLDHYTSGRFVDLHQALLVVPGSRAQRRLLELLLLAAEKSRLTLVAPRTITTGALPEQFYAPRLPLASNLQRLMAWSQALQTIPGDHLRSLLPKRPPDGSFNAWLSLARTIDDLYSEVGRAGLRFTDVVKACQRFDGFVDEERWLVLDSLRELFRSVLAAAGFSDREEERCFAIENGLQPPEREIVLIGSVDLSGVVRNIVKHPAVRGQALIFAPLTLSEGFDELGGLKSTYWSNLEIPIKEEQIGVASGPNGEADLVQLALADWGRKFSAASITIGVCSTELAPLIKRRLEGADVPLHAAWGRRITEFLPVKFLKLARTFLASRQFLDFAELVRHPDVLEWLRIHLPNVAGDFPRDNNLLLLDAYQSDHLQASFGDGPKGTDTVSLRVRQIFAGVRELLKTSAKQQDWLSLGYAVTELLVKLYGSRELLREDPVNRHWEEIFEKLQSALLQIQNLPGGQANLLDAIDLLLAELSDVEVNPSVRTDVVELLGWLELALDDAPALVIAGFNEGCVPEALTAHPFLPEALRRALKMASNDDRFARDTWILQALLHSRKELRVVFGKLSASGDPLAPSRLLLRSQPNVTAKRLEHFLTAIPADLALIREAASSSSRWRLPLPPAPLSNPVNILPVTAFSTYLACPYRFYLKHIKRLTTLDDQALEMEPAIFGSLLHELLSNFGCSAVAASTNPEQIREFLLTSLNALTANRFGCETYPAVRLQLEQLEARLTAFAHWQAGWARSGWEINQCETEFKGPQAILDLGGDSLGLVGRVDRIDYNSRERRYAILDYKTGDVVKRPNDIHRRRGAWCDLQLPAYEYLARKFGLEGNIALGYCAIGADLDEIDVLWAEWDQATLEDARRCMVAVGKKIRAGIFWPPTDKNLPFDDFAELCGTNQLTAEEGHEL